MAVDQRQMLDQVSVVADSGCPGSTQDSASNSGGLVFPWGWEAYPITFKSRRSLAYLSWFRSLPPPAAITPPPEIDRRDLPPDQEVLPDMTPFYASPGSLTAEDVAGLAALGQEVVWTTPGYAGPVAAPQPINAPEDDVGWFEDIYDTIDTGLGGWLPGGVPPGYTGPPPAYATPPMLPMGSGPTQPPSGAPPPVAFCPSGIADDPMKGYVLKKYCGQWRWIKQKGRRRKRLASHSDIKDLSSLLGILGNGKALQSWIATHG